MDRNLPYAISDDLAKQLLGAHVVNQSKKSFKIRKRGKNSKKKSVKDEDDASTKNEPKVAMIKSTQMADIVSQFVHGREIGLIATKTG